MFVDVFENYYKHIYHVVLIRFRPDAFFIFMQQNNLTLKLPYSSVLFGDVRDE